MNSAIAGLVMLLGVSASQDRALLVGSPVECSISPSQTLRFRIEMKAGESAEIDVFQVGVDVIIDLADPGGALLDSFDGPTGRSGIEKVAFVATASGAYSLSIRPFDSREPEGKIELTVRRLRGVAETRRVMEAEARTRAASATWLRPRSVPLLRAGTLLDKTNGLVFGLGEATHGSRELNDARLELTKSLVEKRRVRTIALEFSASRARELEPYAAGQPFSRAQMAENLKAGWIGNRVREALYRWVRNWNLSHPKDKVRVIGVDAQDNGPSRKRLFPFLRKLHPGAEFAATEKELREADEQTAVFGDSSVSIATRMKVLEILTRLRADAAMLRRRHPVAEVEQAIHDARILFEFADFNSDGGTMSRSRDWYMAARVLEAGSAVYWAHNAHVANHRNVAGGFLRAALGRRYVALAATAGEGSFVAQLPNDPEDRLVVSSFAAHRGAAIEDTLRLVRPGAFAAYWGSAPPPAHLDSPQPMHWIGGLFTPGGLASAQYRVFRLTKDFDGAIYFPKAKAEPLPGPRPIVPARKR